MLISIDPAKSAGIVAWQDGKPTHICTLRPVLTTKERKELAKANPGIVFTPTWAVSELRLNQSGVTGKLADRREIPYATRGDAIRELLAPARRKKDALVVMEEGFGKSTLTVKQHAFLRGYIACECEAHGIPWFEVSVSEWRKVVGPKHGFTFPNNSDLAKQRAIEIAADLLPGVEFLNNDETDALMVGLWALYTKTAK